MLQTGVVMIVMGVIVSFGSFIFALINMMTHVTKFGSGDRINVGSLFGGHIGAMIVMVAGGLETFIGFVLVAISLLQMVM